MKSEKTIQDEIRIALSDYGIVIRLNSGEFWQGKIVFSKEFKQNALINLRPVQGCPPGTPDLEYLGNNGAVAFIETKRPGEGLRPEQENFIDLMDQRGITAGVARSVEDALRIIEVTP